MVSNRFLIRMGVGGVGAITLVILLAHTLWSVFLTNPALNGVIIGVLLIGIIYSVQQVLALNPELKWLDAVTNPSRSILAEHYNPKILSPLATLLNKTSHLSPSSLRAVLDGVDARLQESRDISRYLVGLLVFLGLLGTFWGLSSTIQSVSSVIGGLPTGEGVAVSFLDQLKKGLQSPLTGMGVAFSSSLFGLASSLMLGFFELQASQARHAFFGEIEENLTNRVSVGTGFAMQSGSEGSMPAYIQALLEQTAENLDGLQRATARTEQERQILNSNLSALCEKFSILIDQRETEKNLLIKIAEGLIEFQTHLKIFSTKIAENEFGLDKTTKQHISSLNDVTHRLLEVTSTGQLTLAREVRSEIRVLTKTLNNLAGDNSSITAS